MAIFHGEQSQSDGFSSILPVRPWKQSSQLKTSSTEDLRPKHISSMIAPRKGTNEKLQSTMTAPSDDGFEEPQRADLRPLSKDAQVYYSATALSVLIPVIATVVWLGVNAKRWKEFDWSAIHSNIIGGRLTQSQAKAIDLLCSALIAPSILAVFNFVWFSCARVP